MNTKTAIPQTTMALTMLRDQGVSRDDAPFMALVDAMDQSKILFTCAGVLPLTEEHQATVMELEDVSVSYMQSGVGGDAECTQQAATGIIRTCGVLSCLISEHFAAALSAKEKS